MPLEHLKHESNGRTFKVTDALGQDTGRRVYKSFVEQKNVDLGSGNFAPYVWDELNQSIRYGNLSCEFYPDGYQVVREYGSTETLIDDQRFELQYWRTQGQGSWRVLDLFQIGLTVDQQDDYCVVTRKLSDGLGNTLDVEFLFKPKETVKTTFRLHVVEAKRYRIRFQNTGLAGEMIEVPYILGGVNQGITKLLFERMKFRWTGDEIDIHSNYEVETQANGKKLDIFIGNFDLPADGEVVISPDTWGPATTSDDCYEAADTTYYDDNGSGDLIAGVATDTQVDAAFKFLNVTVPAGATCNDGCKIHFPTTGSGNGVGTGMDGVLEIEDSRTPVDYDSTHRPSQRTYHGTVVDFDADYAEADFDSPEIKTVCQARIDDDHVSGDNWAFRWRTNQTSGTNYQAFTADACQLTVEYTPAGTTYYQNAGQGAVAPTGVLSKKTSKYPGGHALTIVGSLNKKTTPVTAMGGHSMSIASTLNKKTTPVTTMGGHSMGIAGVLTKAVVLAQNTGGHAMTITGTLTTVVTFVRAVGGYAMTIVGTLVKKTSKSIGAGQVSSTGILSKKTSKNVGGGSVTSIGTLATAIMYTQAVGGAAMSIIGSLATQFIAGVGGIVKFIRRRKTFYKQ